MRPGVPSEVPPNFWTRIGLVTDSGSAANVALPRQPFRQEDRALAGAELGVVREHDVLHPMERRLVTHPADRDRHAVARISVTAWLRTEGVGGDLQQPIGRRRQTLEPVDAEAFHRRGGSRRIGGALGANVDGFEVPVLDVDSSAGTGKRKSGGVAPRTPELFFLA